MRHLSAAAQAWIAVVLAGGFIALGVAVLQVRDLDAIESLTSPTFVIFLVAACVAHAFPAIAPRHQAYHATQSFLMAAVLVMSWPAVVLIVLATHITEWARRQRPWFIQLYNVAVYLLGAGAAMLTFRYLGTAVFDLTNPLLIYAAVASAVVLLVVNHALTAIVLRLARGVSFSDSGLFGRESLGLDGTLLVVGIAIGGAWRLQPLSLVVTAAPLVLIHRALRLTNVETVSHRDQLSGLYNARHFNEMLDQELRRGQAESHSTGVIVACLDDVPGLVQRYGRATLDFLVARVGERLAAGLRGYDIVARLDEGTFGLLLIGANLDQVRTMAEALAEGVAARSVSLPTTREPVAATLSLAYASVFHSVSDPARLTSLVLTAAQRAALLGPRASVPADVRSIGELPVSTPTETTTGVPLDTPRSIAWSPAGVRLELFEALVIVPSVVLTALVLATRALPDAALAAAVIGLVTISELLAFDLYDRSSFSVSFAPILAAGLLGGPSAALLATWSAALVRGGLRRSRWDRVLFNGSAFSLTGFVATLVATGGARLGVTSSELALLVPLSAVASTVYFLHTFLIAGALALDLRADPKQIWLRNFRWLYPHYIVLGWMGLGLAVATVSLGPLGTALFLAPPLAMRFVLKQYVDRTTGSVQRLEATNAELRAASTLLQQRTEDLALLSDLGQLSAAASRSESLPAVVARRCVPGLGDVVMVVWRGANTLEHTIAGEGAAADALSAQASNELMVLAERVAANGSVSEWARVTGGDFRAAPLVGSNEPLGWLMAWKAQDDVNTELLHEVARRMALVLERDALLDESAQLEALRIVDRAKSDFIATTAHELRTPLTSLQGYAELLRSEVEPGLRDRWLRILSVEAAQLGQVVDQLLDVSRLDSGRFPQAERHLFELRPVLESALATASESATAERHRVVLDIADPPPVYADSAHVDRIMRNLISNALKYSPGGGLVRIVAAARGPAEVEVCVEDCGLGIPAEWLPRLFERFQRVDLPDRATIRGTGLGLYITRQLVELNGGRIWATSDGIDHGTTLHFTLPSAPRVSNYAAGSA